MELKNTENELCASGWLDSLYIISFNMHNNPVKGTCADFKYFKDQEVRNLIVKEHVWDLEKIIYRTPSICQTCAWYFIHLISFNPPIPQNPA